MSKGEAKGSKSLLWCLLILAGVLLVLFARSFNPSLVLFANDGPLGANMAQFAQFPQAFTGTWVDLNWLGTPAGNVPPTPTNLIRWWLGNLMNSKFYSPLCLLILGLSAWAFFRQVQFRPWVCIVGALAAMLNANIFSNVCWGLGTRALCVAGVFGALAFIESSRRGRAWAKLPLAGLSLGIAVMEGADNGAIFSLYVAGYCIWAALSSDDGASVKRIATGIVQVAVVAVFAAFIGTQVLIGLLGVVKGVTTAQETQQSPQQAWDMATTWSLPKAETLRMVIPGLFGYRMDTEKGGTYWGTVGQSPGWEQTKAGWPRYSGAGEYAGVLVVLLAVWAIVESLRRNGQAFTHAERRLIWFWAVAAFISVLFAWGRHAPFYKIVYALPYFSSIRNPIKFMHPAHLSLIILFGYGLQGLSRRYLENVATKATTFERRWTSAMITTLAVSILGLLVFANARRSIIGFLTGTGFSESDAAAVMGFSIREVLLFILFLALSAAMLWLIMKGRFSGPRARWAGVLLGLLLVIDLARANTPWIKYYDYTDKYYAHPIVELLRQRAYEHRVAVLPFQASREFSLLQQIYNVEWLQHHFQYYNVQSLDVTQDPRPPADKAAFTQALMKNITRYWQLTNTRFFFGMPGAFLDMLNQQVDPAQKRFRVHTPFTIDRTPKQESFISITNNTGPFALLEFTGALPRAKLYSQWQVSTNDQKTLEQLASPEFNPEQTVIVAEGSTESRPTNAVASSGSVEFASYSPKHIKFKTKADAPSILLLNDRYDPDWKVFVDGKLTPLLRANFIMRAAQVPAGEHNVEFHFVPKVTGLYITLSAVGLGLLLCAVLLVPRKPQQPVAVQAPLAAVTR
jgi:membrane protein YfhO